MNAPVELRMTKARFLDWVQRQECRYELVNGRPVAVTGGTRAHVVLIGRIVALLSRQLTPDRWHVMPADMALDVGPDNIRYPDVVVEPAGGDLKALSTDRAVLAVEVLSPSSARTDLGDKPVEYTALPNLQAYLVFSQDEPKAWVWLRSDRSFPPGPQPVVGPDREIEIPALGVSIPLAEIYRGLLPAESDAVA